MPALIPTNGTETTSSSSLSILNTLRTFTPSIPSPQIKNDWSLSWGQYINLHPRNIIPNLKSMGYFLAGIVGLANLPTINAGTEYIKYDAPNGDEYDYQLYINEHVSSFTDFLNQILQLPGISRNEKTRNKFCTIESLMPYVEFAERCEQLSTEVKVKILEWMRERYETATKENHSTYLTELQIIAIMMAATTVGVLGACAYKLYRRRQEQLNNPEELTIISDPHNWPQPSYYGSVGSSMNFLAPSQPITTIPNSADHVIDIKRDGETSRTPSSSLR